MDLTRGGDERRGRRRPGSAQSRMWCPSSVTNGVAARRAAQVGVVEQRRAAAARVPSQPKRTTSTGSRQRSPRCVTSLRDSATITQRAADSITSFSRSRAPPPPLSTAQIARPPRLPRRVRDRARAPLSGSPTPIPGRRPTTRAVSGEGADDELGRRSASPSPCAGAHTARPGAEARAACRSRRARERRAHGRGPRRIGAQRLTSGAARSGTRPR